LKEMAKCSFWQQPAMKVVAQLAEMATVVVAQVLVMEEKTVGMLMIVVHTKEDTALDWT